MKILDCTLRDGGYYTNWDFSDEVVDNYCRALSGLPIDTVEVGYRSKPLSGYYGKYFYCPTFVLEHLKASLPGKTLAVMFNEKDCTPSLLKDLLVPIKGLVGLIRFAVDPGRIQNMPALLRVCHELGFLTATNLMYASKYRNDVDALIKAASILQDTDFLNLVDSYGGLYPHEVTKMVSGLKSNSTCEIGYHGHDNLELAFANALAALEAGAGWLDSTVKGMGRGAGNLKTELLLTHLASDPAANVDMDSLSSLVDTFENLHAQYQWGTNLPYMVSGASSLPQNDVMDWVSKRYYSMNSIVRALGNQKSKLPDNAQLPKFDPIKTQANEILVLGGGSGSIEHATGIREWIEGRNLDKVIHASAKNSRQFKSIKPSQIYCLVGNEGHRLERVFDLDETPEGIAVLPPYPRKMGTYVPKEMEGRSFELREVSFTDRFKDSHTALALQTAIDCGATTVYFAGYDGYPVSMNSKEKDLFQENEYLFTKAADSGIELVSLTPTSYSKLNAGALYSSI